LGLLKVRLSWLCLLKKTNPGPQGGKEAILALFETNASQAKMRERQVFSISLKSRHILWRTLAMMLTARLILSTVSPLTDTTEARYAEIARKMLETADWVTPQYAYGVPFWGKPPLSTWLSAASMKALGVNEFAARLPELLLALGILWLIWHLAKERHNRDFALLSIALAASLPLFFIAGGAVMTDASLAFSSSLSFVAFWLVMSQTKGRNTQLWGYLFFVGQGLGLLAKGPICLILTMGPIFIWALVRGKQQWRLIWTRLPWLSGALLTFAIAAPWYFLAESRTPGFLNYFIIGEHFQRFLVSGWSGDRYGRPHSVPAGTIWLYWLAGALPWSLIAVTWLARRARILGGLLQDRDGWAGYLLCWTIFPMLFFSMAHNILWTYTITGLPAFALLFLEIWHRSRVRAGSPVCLSGLVRFQMLFNYLGITAVVVCLIVVIAPSQLHKVTQKYLVQRYLQIRPSADSGLHYLFKRPYSAEFYSTGLARQTANQQDLYKLLSNHSRDYIAVKQQSIDGLPGEVRHNFQLVDTLGDTLLLVEKIPQAQVGTMLLNPFLAKEITVNE
jgi:4-amino-4-deoxy-L-arabinose transferase-like glycosyltransferase